MDDLKLIVKILESGAFIQLDGGTLTFEKGWWVFDKELTEYSEEPTEFETTLFSSMYEYLVEQKIV